MMFLKLLSCPPLTSLWAPLCNPLPAHSTFKSNLAHNENKPQNNMIVKMLAAKVINKEINKCITTETCLAPRPSDTGALWCLSSLVWQPGKWEDTSSLLKDLIGESYTEIDFLKSHCKIGNSMSELSNNENNFTGWERWAACPDAISEHMIRLCAWMLSSDIPLINLRIEYD